MSLSYHQQRFAQDIAKLITFIYSQNYACTLGEAFRTPEQAEIYAQKGIGIKNSQHCRRLGCDINLFSPEGKYLTDSKDYEPFGIYWESLDPLNKSGCFFQRMKDGNHFERRA
jgi:hypothetical protein